MFFDYLKLLDNTTDFVHFLFHTVRKKKKYKVNKDKGETSHHVFKACFILKPLYKQELRNEWVHKELDSKNELLHQKKARNIFFLKQFCIKAFRRRLIFWFAEK